MATVRLVFLGLSYGQEGFFLFPLRTALAGQPRCTVLEPCLPLLWTGVVSPPRTAPDLPLDVLGPARPLGCRAVGGQGFTPEHEPAFAWYVLRVCALRVVCLDAACVCAAWVLHSCVLCAA